MGRKAAHPKAAGRKPLPAKPAATPTLTRTKSHHLPGNLSELSELSQPNILHPQTPQSSHLQKCATQIPSLSPRKGPPAQPLTTSLSRPTSPITNPPRSISPHFPVLKDPPAPTSHLTPSKRVTIQGHTIGADNPFHLQKVIHSLNLRIQPPSNYYSRKNQSTLLIFQSTDDALKFVSQTPTSTFGTNTSYAFSPQKTKSNSPTTAPRSPLLHVVVRGVHVEVGEDEFLSQVPRPLTCPCEGFTRARRIVGQGGAPTGLVRLFSACEACVAATLEGGLCVLGRTYRVEPPHHQMIRPCPRCHLYGHGRGDCHLPNPLCRVCGTPHSGNGPCLHDDHDLSRPFCVSCGSYGHYTGQRHCPLYPKNPTPELLNPPVRFRPAPLPVSNPWKLTLEDFPPICPPPPEFQDEPTPIFCPAPTPIALTNPPPCETQTQPTPVQAPSSTLQFVTIDSLTAFLEKFLTVVSEGFKRTFDSLTAIILSSIPPKDQPRVKGAINKVSKSAFDMRTIFHSVGSGLTLLHSNARRV